MCGIETAQAIAARRLVAEIGGYPESSFSDEALLDSLLSQNERENVFVLLGKKFLKEPSIEEIDTFLQVGDLVAWAENQTVLQ